MRISYEHPKIEPTELYELLRRHALLPVHLGETQLIWTIKTLSDKAVFALIVEDTEEEPAVLATTMTLQVDPGVLGFTWIPEVKKLHARRNELIDLGAEFRRQWFHGEVRRVEARVPLSRTQTTRALKAMGFRQETLDWGLRAAVDYGRGPEGVAVLGLLETDAPREKHEMQQEAEVGT